MARLLRPAAPRSPAGRQLPSPATTTAPCPTPQMLLSRPTPGQAGHARHGRGRKWVRKMPCCCWLDYQDFLLEDPSPFTFFRLKETRPLPPSGQLALCRKACAIRQPVCSGQRDMSRTQGLPVTLPTAHCPPFSLLVKSPRDGTRSNNGSNSRRRVELLPGNSHLHLTTT